MRARAVKEDWALPLGETVALGEDTGRVGEARAETAAEGDAELSLVAAAEAEE